MSTAFCVDLASHCFLSPECSAPGPDMAAGSCAALVLLRHDMFHHTGLTGLGQPWKAYITCKSAIA